MMKLRFDKRLYVMLAVIIIALVGVFVAAALCIYQMRAAIDRQVYANLADVADQTDSVIEKQVESYYNLMVNIRTELETMEKEDGRNVEEAIEEFASYAKDNGFVRVAFCEKDGTAYGSDQVDRDGTDLHDREFYIRGMEGKSTITTQLKDRMNTDGDETPINILAAPWYDENGEIRGVFGITFYAEKLSELLSVNAFDGNGGSFAVSYEVQKNDDGTTVLDGDGNAVSAWEIVIDSTTGDADSTSGVDVVNSHANRKILDVLGQDEANDEMLSTIEAQLNSGETCQGTVYIDGDKKLYYQQTLSFECLGGDVQWRIFTVVSKSYVHDRFFTVNLAFYMLVLMFMLIFLLSIAALLILAQRHRRSVEKVAYVDSVTGGDNYPMYVRRLRGTKERGGAFVSMDLVEFNSVRVAVGAERGQDILKEVDIAISQLLGENELIAHVDRDEFALFLAVTDPKELIGRIKEISERLLGLSHELDVPHIRIRCGVYISERFDRSDLDDCFNCAGQAREMARKNNRSYWIYDEADNEQQLYERKLVGYFNEALANEEFEVWYQPKYSVSTGKIVGAEALVRWRREDKLIPPGKFIPLFESNGMVAKLDEYMFRQVCMRQKQRVAEGKRVEPVSVNLSRATMYNDHIAEKYMGILEDYGVDVKHVQIEITESAVVGKDNLTLLLHEFKNMGEHILLDDFGTGYSSMSILSTKCFDTLKIDKSLMDNIGNESGETLVSSIIQMAHKLNMSVTAEGVESESQYKQLRILKCDAIQGFYFSKPLPMAKYEELLDKGM